MIALVSARALLERIDQELALRAAAPEVQWRAGAREAFAFAAQPSRGASALRPPDLGPAPAPLVHALAVIESARFGEIERGTSDAAITESATAAIRAWSELAKREAYLVELARGMGASVTLPAMVDVAARRGVDQVSSALAARVHDGRDLAPLLRALSLVASDAGPSVLPTPTRMLADRGRVDAIEALLAPLRSVFDDLGARSATEGELVAIFTRVHESWRRSDRDIELEILAVERLPDFAWDFYREKRFKELARVLVPLAEPVASLSARIERGESAIAWAAPCAQAVVFRAELADRFDQQIELAERAYAICPSLRNARVVLGDFLITRAERALDRGAPETSKGTLPGEDLSRAEALYPELRRLPAAKKKLAAKTGPVRT